MPAHPDAEDDRGESNYYLEKKAMDEGSIKREIIQAVEIKENRFGFEPEITAKIAKMGVRIKEVPISYYPRTNEEGKKIGLKDGIRAIYCIWKYRRG